MYEPDLSHFAMRADQDEVVTRLNSGCFCITLDRQAVRRIFESVAGVGGLADLVDERCPNAFAARPVFVAERHIDHMVAIIEAVESVVALPAYRETVLAQAPDIARQEPTGARSVFFGYDFHVGKSGISLIEINTNAGGAMLNAVLGRAQRACCAEVTAYQPKHLHDVSPEQQIFEMFRNEWALADLGRPLRSIAIVDENPEQQYMYPEFLLFQRLFQRHGLTAIVTGPDALEWRNGILWHGETAIDMVYNRLTDFAFATPSSEAIRSAYLAGATLITPHPRAHALYADKRNLALLCDDDWLQKIGVPKATRDVLVAWIPRTEIVNAANAERLWGERRKLFFKPTAGFGGRAAYRGEKLTKRVWQEILAGNYVAQSLVAPGERMMDTMQTPRAMKFDVRAYAYDGSVQMLVARLYQGQTTNFRTPGGGFASVYRVAQEKTHLNTGAGTVARECGANAN